MATTTFQVGGKNYEIGGMALHGTMAKWQMVKLDGQALSEEQFEAMSPQEKQEFTKYVDEFVSATGLGGVRPA